MSNYLATFGKPRFLGIVPLDDDEHASIQRDRIFVARSHRGEELAELIGAITEEQEREYRELRTITEHGEGPLRGGDPVVTDLSFVRVPTDDDIEEREQQEASNMETLRAAQELVEWNKLDVKLVDTEMLLGGKKLFFYFTADSRVDFRTLVKDLARRFRTRIELRQMGVRDEARILRGMATCGLPCCCSYWLNDLTPIGIKMVKEQNIALNPAKISGICGRLMCCMAFEHKTYKELWADLPGPGSKIKTPTGSYIVIAVDLAREAVRCHRPDGGDVVVPVGLFEEFRDAVMSGEEWQLPEDAISEYDLRKKNCSSCRRSQADDFDFSKFEGPSEPTQRQKAEEAQPEREPHRRRRRPKRGGRRREDEAGQELGAASVRQHSETQSDDAQPHRRRPRRRRRRPGTFKNGEDARGDQ